MSDETKCDQPIYMATVSAPTNIACIKYWGKASVEYNTPINSSVSVTLDQSDLCATTTASASLSYTEDKLWLNGIEENPNKRFYACLNQVRALASDKIDPETGDVIVSADQWKQMKVHVSSYNTFPTAAGLASSAAGYAALVSAFKELFHAKESFPGEFTTIARQGSGSACRSLYGGFVAWRKGSAEDGWKNSFAEQVCDENHWSEIRALILVVSDEKKTTSSTKGMSNSVSTSRLLQHRAECVVDERMEQIEAAYHQKDFPTFAKLTMADSNQFHATCLDTYPPIFYMNDVSKQIINLIHCYNDYTGEIRAGYTFDAGPNAVIYTLEKYSVEVTALMLHWFPSINMKEYMTCSSNADMLEKVQSFSLDPELIKATDAVWNLTLDQNQTHVKHVYFTKSGPGPLVLTEDNALIDTATGLNTYQP